MQTLYTVGDVHTIETVLLGIQGIFNHPMFIDPSASFGLGYVILPGILFIFLSGLVSGVFNQTHHVSYIHMVMAILLFNCMFLPKTQIAVEDRFNGQVAVVDDIPVGLVYPLTISSSVMQKFTEMLTTAYTPPSAMGENLMTSQDGFVKPLRTLLALQKVTLYGLADQNNTANLNSFAQYCTKGADGTVIDINSIVQSADLITDFANSANAVSASAYMYSQTFPFPGQGQLVSCEVLAGNIATSATSYFSGNFKNDLLKQVGEKPTTYSGNAADLAKESLGSLISDHVNVDPARAIQNIVIGKAIRDALNGKNSNSDIDFKRSLIENEAAERFKARAFVDGSLFQKIMYPMMSIMVILLIAFTPIVAFMVVFMGHKSIKMLVSFLMALVWTQSWLPTAAIINSYMLISLSNKFNDLLNPMGSGVSAGQLFSIQGMDVFYETVSTQLSIGSSMMAATPMVSLALLMGSANALSSLASRQGGNADVDVDKIAPRVDADSVSNAKAQTESLIKAGVSATALSALHGGSTATQQQLANLSMPQVSAAVSNSSTVKDVLQSERGAAVENAHQSATRLAHQIMQSGTKGNSTQKTLMAALEKLLGTNKGNTYGTSSSSGTKSLQQLGLTEESSSRVSEALSAVLGISGGAAAGKILAMALKAGASGTISEDAAEAIKLMQSNGHSEEAAVLSNTLSQVALNKQSAAKTVDGLVATNAIANEKKATASKDAVELDTSTRKVTEANKALSAFEHAQQVSQNASTNFSTPGAIITAAQLALEQQNKNHKAFGADVLSSTTKSMKDAGASDKEIAEIEQYAQKQIAMGGGKNDVLAVANTLGYFYGRNSSSGAVKSGALRGMAMLTRKASEARGQNVSPAAADAYENLAIASERATKAGVTVGNTKMPTPENVPGNINQTSQTTPTPESVAANNKKITANANSFIQSTSGAGSRAPVVDKGRDNESVVAGDHNNNLKLQGEESEQRAVDYSRDRRNLAEAKSQDPKFEAGSRADLQTLFQGGVFTRQVPGIRPDFSDTSDINKDGGARQMKNALTIRDFVNKQLPNISKEHPEALKLTQEFESHYAAHQSGTQSELSPEKTHTRAYADYVYGMQQLLKNDYNKLRAMEVTGAAYDDDAAQQRHRSSSGHQKMPASTGDGTNNPSRR